MFQHGQWRCASETKPSSDTGSVGRISFVEVLDLQLLNMLRHRFHAGHDVADQALARVRRHQAEEVAGLRVVIAVEAVIARTDGERILIVSHGSARVRRHFLSHF